MSTNTSTHYAERNPRKLEPHYAAHMVAMTREQLYEKSEIACELAWRDQQIAELRAQVEALKKEVTDEKETADWHKQRTSLLQRIQRSMEEPERTIVCDVLANGHLLQGPDGKPDKQRYAQPQPLTRPAVTDTPPPSDVVHSELVRFADIIRDCGRIVDKSGRVQKTLRRASAMLAAVPQPEQVAPFQTRVQPWLMECFGEMIAGDREERNHRFLEEALELVQACGCTASEAHQLVDYTFGRPIGEPAQEVGGVMVTLAALCLANRLDMHANGETELTRINAPEMVKKIRAKQAAKPKYSPLPEAAPQPEAAQKGGS